MSERDPRAAEAPWLLRPIRPADDRAIAAVIRTVMTEYRCTGEGFAIHDPEVDFMSRAYDGADAHYVVVERAGEVLGGGGFARLHGTGPDEATCELRKMYFLPPARGRGLGRALLRQLLAEMRACGYRRCYLETTSWMKEAQSLYRSEGFAPLCGSKGATGHHGCDTFFERAL